MTHWGTHTVTRSVSEGERSVDVIRQRVPGSVRPRSRFGLVSFSPAWRLAPLFGAPFRQLFSRDHVMMSFVRTRTLSFRALSVLCIAWATACFILNPQSVVAGAPEGAEKTPVAANTWAHIELKGQYPEG